MSAPTAEPVPAAPVAQESRGNPGPFGMLSSAIFGVFPSPFKGIELTLQRGITGNFVLGHHISLNGKESAYHFRPTYVGTLNKKSEQESYPVCVGDLSTSGDLTANVIHEFAEGFKVKLQVQASPEDVDVVLLENEYTGQDFTAALRFVNINPAEDRGILSAQYFQSVTSKLALGTEFNYQYHAKGEQGALHLGGRYTTSEWNATGMLTTSGMFQATYMHSINPQIVAACDFNVNLPAAQVTSSVGVKYAFPTSVYKAQVTSEGSVIGAYEKHLAPGFSFLMSFIVNHAKGDSSVGVGLQIGG